MDAQIRWFSPAGEHVLALVSGLSSGKRYSRLVLMLQAYFDDSTESGNALIFAGYLASVDTWLKFSDDWTGLLTIHPKMRRFKMKEISPERMERAGFHYCATDRHGLAAIGCAIPIEPLARIVSELNLDPALANPYYLAWRAVITMSLMGAEFLGSRDPIEFVFDDQTEKINIIKAWDSFYAGAPATVRKRIRGSPSFKRDDDLVALQAADMVAWWARKQYVADKSRMKDLFPNEWTKGKEPTLFFSEIPEEKIRLQLRKDIANAKVKESEIRVSGTLKCAPWL